MDAQWTAFVEDLYETREISRAIFFVASLSQAHEVERALIALDHTVHVFEHSIYVDASVYDSRVWIVPFPVWRNARALVEEELLSHQNMVVVHDLRPAHEDTLIEWMADARRRGFLGTKGLAQWWVSTGENYYVERV